MSGYPHTWEADMVEDITFVGLDVSKKAISVGIAPGVITGDKLDSGNGQIL